VSAAIPPPVAVANPSMTQQGNDFFRPGRLKI